MHGLKEVAVAFSGGLDSSIIAYLAAKQGIKVNLLHVSMENEPETEEAIAAAEALNLPMQSRPLQRLRRRSSLAQSCGVNRGS